MNIQILYNNKDIFNGISNIPFVSFDQNIIDFGNKWNQITNITLEGQLTGKYIGTYSNKYLNDSFNKLLSGFSDNYKSFRVLENGSEIYNAGIVTVNSIEIGENNWYGVVPYTISLTAYEQNLFSDYYGIVEPKENFSFQDSENESLTLTHSLSAKGIKIDNNTPLTNAKNWVKQRTGDVNKIAPILVKNDINKLFVLYSIKETIDRFNGTYSWEGEYRKSNNIESPNNSFLNYTINLNSGIDNDFLEVNINGSLEGNIISNLRQDFNNLNLYNIATNIAQNTFNSTLSSRVVTQSIEEIEESNKLNFNVSYNNDFSSNIINDYTVETNTDILRCLSTARINANISCKYGDRASKWLAVKDFYESSFDPYSLALLEFNKDKPSSSSPLINKPVTESLEENQFEATIRYTAEYTNKKTFISDNILNMSSQVNFTPSFKLYVSNTSATTSEEHNVQDLNVRSRARISISINAQGKMGVSLSSIKSEVLSELNRIKGNYNTASNRIIESFSLTENQDLNTVSAEETLSFEQSSIN